MATPPCTAAIFHDAQHFLDMFDRLLPDSYLAPLKSPGPGYEVLQAYAQVFQRVSLAAARLDCGAHILDSYGNAFSLVTVEFRRPDIVPVWPAPGSATIKAGTLVRTSNGGRRYATLTDVTFLTADLGPKAVQARALEASFEFDVPGQAVAKDGTVLEGDIDIIDTLITSPPYPNTGMPNFTVTNPLAASGGMCGLLDGLGQDRGLPRNPGESDAPYKVRIRTLPDTVSPAAIRRAVNDYLSAYCGGTLAFDFIETWQANYQTVWDCPSPNPGTPTFSASLPPGIDLNLFTYDDPRPIYPPFRNRWLSEEDFRGAFIIVVPNIDAVSDVGMGYDDTAVVPADLLTDCGARAVGAYDVPSGYAFSLEGGYDGFDLGKQAIYKGLSDLLDRIKAGGVLAVIELSGE